MTGVFQEGVGSEDDILELDEEAAWVVGSGRVELTDTAIVITHETSDGAKWKVEDERVDDPDWR